MELKDREGNLAKSAVTSHRTMSQLKRNPERHSQITKAAYYLRRLGAVRVNILTAAQRKVETSRTVEPVKIFPKHSRL